VFFLCTPQLVTTRFANSQILMAESHSAWTRKGGVIDDHSQGVCDARQLGDWTTLRILAC
jgi:hypothetical protein